MEKRRWRCCAKCTSAVDRWWAGWRCGPHSLGAAAQPTPDAWPSSRPRLPLPHALSARERRAKSQAAPATATLPTPSRRGEAAARGDAGLTATESAATTSPPLHQPHPRIPATSIADRVVLPSPASSHRQRFPLRCVCSPSPLTPHPSSSLPMWFSAAAAKRLNGGRHFDLSAHLRLAQQRDRERQQARQAEEEARQLAALTAELASNRVQQRKQRDRQTTQQQLQLQAAAAARRTRRRRHSAAAADHWMVNPFYAPPTTTLHPSPPTSPTSSSSPFLPSPGVQLSSPHLPSPSTHLSITPSLIASVVHCVRTNDPTTLSHLLTSHPPPLPALLTNLTTSHTRTSLLHLALTCHPSPLPPLPLLTLLLTHHADPNSCDSSRSTPLHLACAQGQLKVVALLMERGGDVEVVNERGEGVWEVGAPRVRRWVGLMKRGMREGSEGREERRREEEEVGRVWTRGFYRRERQVGLARGREWVEGRGSSSGSSRRPIDVAQGGGGKREEEEREEEGEERREEGDEGASSFAAFAERALSEEAEVVRGCMQRRKGQRSSSGAWLQGRGHDEGSDGGVRSGISASSIASLAGDSTARRMAEEVQVQSCRSVNPLGSPTPSTERTVKSPRSAPFSSSLRTSSSTSSSSASASSSTVFFSTVFVSNGGSQRSPRPLPHRPHRPQPSSSRRPQAAPLTTPRSVPSIRSGPTTSELPVHGRGVRSEH